MTTARRHADVNAVVGGYLRDLAFAQANQQKMFGYKRAAAAILSLETPLTDLIDRNGQLPKIPGIGPGSERVIREVLDSGDDATTWHRLYLEAILPPGSGVVYIGSFSNACSTGRGIFGNLIDHCTEVVLRDESGEAQTITSTHFGGYGPLRSVPAREYQPALQIPREILQGMRWSGVRHR